MLRAVEIDLRVSSARQLWLKLQRPPSPYWRSLIADAQSERYTYTPWAYVSVFLILVSLGSVLLVNGALWGMFIAARVARVMSHNGQALETLSVTPLGQSGVGWQVVASVVHDDIQLEHFLGLRRLAISILVLPLALILPVLALVTLLEPGYMNLNRMLILMAVLSLLPVAYLDPIYGLLTGALVAILAARHSASDAQAQALSITLGLHLSAFALPALLAFVGMPLLYRGLGLWSGLAALSLGLIAVGGYIGLHEGCIRFLWRRVQEQR